MWYEHFRFSRKVSTIHKWGSQILLQQKLFHYFSPTLLYKEKYYIARFVLFFVTISNNSLWAHRARAKVVQPTFGWLVLFTFICYSVLWNSSPVLLVLCIVAFLSWNDLILPSNSCRIRMSLRKIDGSICRDTIRSFCFQHVVEIWASLFSNESKDSVILLSQEWLFFLEWQLASENTEETQRISN